MKPVGIFIGKLRSRLRGLALDAFAVRGAPRPIDRPDLSAAVPFVYDPVGVPDGTIAVICPIFHADLAEELRALIANIPFPTDVYVSTDSDAKRTVIEAAFRDWPNGRVEVRITPNRGRDIAPKLTTFRDVYPRYRLMLYLHSKKSLTSTIGAQWRQSLTDTLVGSPAVVRSIVDIFARRPEIGIVMAQHFEPIGHMIRWDGNFRSARALARRMGIALTHHHVIDMPSGSMFWFRPAALAPLLTLGLKADDFPPERDQVGGTLQHAIERLVLFVAEQAGYDWLKVAAPAHFLDQGRIRQIADPTGLDAFVTDSRFRLLRQPGHRDRWCFRTICLRKDDSLD